MAPTRARRAPLRGACVAAPSDRRTPPAAHGVAPAVVVPVVRDRRSLGSVTSARERPNAASVHGAARTGVPHNGTSGAHRRRVAVKGASTSAAVPLTRPRPTAPPLFRIICGAPPITWSRPRRGPMPRPRAGYMGARTANRGLEDPRRVRLEMRQRPTYPALRLRRLLHILELDAPAPPTGRAEERRPSCPVRAAPPLGGDGRHDVIAAPPPAARAPRPKEDVGPGDSSAGGTGPRR